MIVLDFFRTLVWFVYFFGYLIVHLGPLNRGKRLLEAGDDAAVDAIVAEYVPRWCKTLLRLAGDTVTVEGAENIPQDTACVFVGNHRSYYDIPLMLTCLDGPHALVSKQEVAGFPMVRVWMQLLRCVFVQRDDVRASLTALNKAAENVKNGHSIVIFPEGTRFKGPEGGIGEFKGGAFRIALKTGAPVVPVAISHSRDAMENNHMLMRPTHMTVKILPAIDVKQLDKAGQKELSGVVQRLVQQNLTDYVPPENAENPYHRLYTENRTFSELRPTAETKDAQLR